MGEDGHKSLVFCRLLQGFHSQIILLHSTTTLSPAGRKWGGALALPSSLIGCVSTSQWGDFALADPGFILPDSASALWLVKYG